MFSYNVIKEGKNLNALPYIRYSVAFVFITSGLMKMINEDLGNSFIGLGLPFPIYIMYFVAFTEIVCGFLMIVDKHVKTATIPLIMIMIAAILLTKIPLLQTGLVSFAFSARLDIVMLVLLAILYKNSFK